MTALVNYNKIKNRRVDFTLNFPLDMPTQKLSRIISKIKMYLQNNPKILEKTVFIGFTGISNYSNQIRIFCYVDESKYVRYLEIQEEINFAIMRILDSENVNLATPTQTLRFSEENMKRRITKAIDVNTNEELNEEKKAEDAFDSLEHDNNISEFLNK